MTRYIVKLERIKPTKFQSKLADNGLVWADNIKEAKIEALSIYGFEYKILEIK